MVSSGLLLLTQLLEDGANSPQSLELLSGTGGPLGGAREVAGKLGASPVCPGEQPPQPSALGTLVYSEPQVRACGLSPCPESGNQVF